MKINGDGRIVLTQAPGDVHLIAVGDLIPGGRASRCFANGDMQPIFGETLPFFTNADYVVFNLESPLCSSETAIRKCGENFQVDPETAKGLKHTGFNIASLANNHIMDFGESGLQSTIQALDKYGILWLGAGKSAEEASLPLKTHLNGIDFAFLNFAEGEFSKAEERKAGAAPLDLWANLAAIEQARQSSNVVIVSVHAGKEYQHFPSPWIQNVYRKYIEHGANLVLGHHPHIPQGVESYRGGIICYSLGDFLFEYPGDPGITATCAASIQIGKEGCHSLELVPIAKTKSCKMEFMNTKEKRLFFNHLRRISEPLADEKELSKLYQQSVIRHFELFYGPYLKSKIDNIRTGKSEKEISALFLYNMMDCDSHRYALKTVFQLMYEGNYKKQPHIQAYIDVLNSTLEVLGDIDRIEPYRKIETLKMKIARHSKKLVDAIKTHINSV